MISIGEFSKICDVTTKTLRYYEEIGLIKPAQINNITGYRYYEISQLDTMLIINKLKAYNFSLDEIKEIIINKNTEEDDISLKLMKKKDELNQKIELYERTINQIDNDLNLLSQGMTLLSYMDDIDVKLADVPEMCILYVRCMVQRANFPEKYGECYGKLFRRIHEDKLTMMGAPMVLFHSNEFTCEGLDTEFAIPVKEYVTGTRTFTPGLCLKTVLHGSYDNLSAVYTKQAKYAEEKGYQNKDAVFEVYLTDPKQVRYDDELITEIYNPVRKI